MRGRRRMHAGRDLRSCRDRPSRQCRPPRGDPPDWQPPADCPCRCHAAHAPSSFRSAAPQAITQRRQHRLVGEVHAAGIHPAFRVQPARQEDSRVGAAERFDCGCGIDGVGHQLVDGHRLVGDPVDEGRVGAVLQKAAHQIGQKRLVRADRRVDAAGPVQPLRTDDFLVERFPIPCRHWNSYWPRIYRAGSAIM